MKILPLLAAGTLAFFITSAGSANGQDNGGELPAIDGDSGADEMQNLRFFQGGSTVLDSTCDSAFASAIRAGWPELGTGMAIFRNKRTAQLNSNGAPDRLLFVGPEPIRTEAGAAPQSQREVRQRIFYSWAKASKKKKKSRLRTLNAAKINSCELHQVNSNDNIRPCFVQVEMRLGKNTETFQLMDVLDCDGNLAVPERTAAVGFASFSGSDLVANYDLTSQTCVSAVQSLIRMNRGDKYNIQKKNRSIKPDVVSGSGDTGLYLMSSPWLWVAIKSTEVGADSTGPGLLTKGQPTLVGAENVKSCIVYRNKVTDTECVYQVDLDLYRSQAATSANNSRFHFQPETCVPKPMFNPGS